MTDASPCDAGPNNAGPNNAGPDGDGQPREVERLQRRIAELEATHLALSQKEESLRTCAEAVAARKNIEMEFRLRGADGQYRWFLDHGVPIYSFGGEFLGYIGTSVDVTQRREDQEMLLRSERLAAIGEAMAGLSHESRNALQRSQSSRERIFDAFRTTKARGTGLGLAITRRLIEAHDGRISAGDSPDGGAEFSICLPRQLRAALPG